MTTEGRASQPDGIKTSPKTGMARYYACPHSTTGWQEEEEEEEEAIE